MIREGQDFLQVQYQEFDRLPDPQYITLCIQGWVPAPVLADTRRRHFFHLVFAGQSPQQWETLADNHVFTPFWVPLDALPSIIPPQDGWLQMLKPVFAGLRAGF